MNISIVIPAYNASLYLEACLQSCIVSAQYAHVKFELIVIDDGSSDNTASIAKKWAHKFIQQSHKGAGAARNAGIAQAEGSYILFLDADDLLTEHAVSDLYTALTQNPNMQMACALTSDFISPELNAEQKKLFNPRPVPYAGTLPGMLIKNDTFEQVGSFDVNLKTAETVDWLVRAQEASITKLHIESITLLRRLHPKSTSACHKIQERKDYLSILRKKHNKKHEKTS